MHRPSANQTSSMAFGTRQNRPSANQAGRHRQADRQRDRQTVRQCNWQPQRQTHLYIDVERSSKNTDTVSNILSLSGLAILEANRFEVETPLQRNYIRSKTQIVSYYGSLMRKEQWQSKILTSSWLHIVLYIYIYINTHTHTHTEDTYAETRRRTRLLNVNVSSSCNDYKLGPMSCSIRTEFKTNTAIKRDKSRLTKQYTTPVALTEQQFIQSEHPNNQVIIRHRSEAMHLLDTVLVQNGSCWRMFGALPCFNEMSFIR